VKQSSEPKFLAKDKQKNVVEDEKAVQFVSYEEYMTRKASKNLRMSIKKS